MAQGAEPPKYLSCDNIASHATAVLHIGHLLPARRRGRPCHAHCCFKQCGLDQPAMLSTIPLQSAQNKFCSNINPNARFGFYETTTDITFSALLTPRAPAVSKVLHQKQLSICLSVKKILYQKQLFICCFGLLLVLLVMPK